MTSVFKFDLCYSYRGLARVISEVSGNEMDHKKLKRLLTKGKVFPRPDGKIWISDIEREMKHFLDSFFELKHQRDLAEETEGILEEDR